MDEQKEKELLWMIFKVADQLYAINSKNILNIGVLPDKITYVPDVEDYVKGMIKNRGKMVTLLDIRMLFSEERLEECCKSVMIVMENEKEKPIGMVVDEIIGVEKLGIQYHESILDKMQHSQLVSGVALREQGDELLLLMDEDKLFCLGEDMESEK